MLLTVTEQTLAENKLRWHSKPGHFYVINYINTRVVTSADSLTVPGKSICAEVFEFTVVDGRLIQTGQGKACII